MHTHQNLNIPIQGNPVICPGRWTTLDAGPHYAHYSWSTGSEESSIVVSEPGEYQVTVTTPGGCQGIGTIMVNIVERAPLNIIGEQILCPGEKMDLSVENSGDHFAWSTGQEGPMITIDSAGRYQVTVTNAHGCEAITAIEIESPKLPKLKLKEPGVITCLDTLVTLGLASTFSNDELYHAVWVGQNEEVLMEDSNQLTVSEPGWYTFKVEHQASGCIEKASVFVSENRTPPIINAGLDQQLDCQRSMAQLGAPPNTQIKYFWRFADGQINAPINESYLVVKEPGFYYLDGLLIDNGCKASDTVLVTANFTLPELSLPDRLAMGCHDAGIEILPNYQLPDSKALFTWVDGMTGDTLGQQPHLTIQSAGFYLVYLRDLSNGCLNSDVITIDPSEGLQKMESHIQHPSCTYAEDGQIFIDTIIGGTAPYLFQLNDQSSTTSRVFDGLSPGVYSLLVKDGNGCQWTKEFRLQAKSDPTIELGPDQTIDFGDVLHLTAYTNLSTDDAATLTWQIGTEEISCQDCLVQKVIPEKNSRYTVSLTTAAGCTVSDEIKVKVNQPRKYYIPNAFSPNGDGYNDFFAIAGGTDIKVIKHISIFNRWGLKVYEQINIPPNDPTLAWHGYCDGQPCSSGVYVYRAEVEFVDGLILKVGGDVVLTR